MDESSLSIYNLITDLCEKFSSNPKCTGKLRIQTYELLLGKRKSPQEKSFKDLRSSADPHCNLLAWEFILANQLNLRKHAEKLQEYSNYLVESYSPQPLLFKNILRFLLELRNIPKHDDANYMDLSTVPCFDEPESFRELFLLPKSLVCDAAQYCDNSFYLKSKRRVSSSSILQGHSCTCPNSASQLSCQSIRYNEILNDEGYVSPTKNQEEDLWEIVSKSKYSDRKTWESYGHSEPEKELPFLSEMGAMSSLWVENLQSLYFTKMFRDGVVLRSQMRPRKEFIKDTKYLLVGLGSVSFSYGSTGDFYLIPGISLEGITPDQLTLYCKDFILSGHCYKALFKMSNPNSSTGQFKQNGYIFAELCESLSRYLMFHRTAVFSIPDSTSLLEFSERTAQLRNQIKTLASVCKVGPYIESEQVPHGIALLNYLYQKVLSLSDKNVLMVLYSILFPCCQVYFSRFLQQWILHGAVNDPYGEFLVKPNFKYTATRGRTYWTRSYVLREDIVPDFLIDLKGEILNCGKAMNLLKLSVSSSKLCLYLRNKTPLIVTCCLTSEQLASLEKNATSYYLEASAECGPKVSMATIFAKSQDTDPIFTNLIAKKRAVTLKRLELERQKCNSEKLEKKLEEMAMLKEQYHSAMIQKQTKISSEIEKEIKTLEGNLAIEAMRNKLIKEEANKLIEYYDHLCEMSDRHRQKVEQNLKNMQNYTMEHSPPKLITEETEKHDNCTAESAKAETTTIERELPVIEVQEEQCPETTKVSNLHSSKSLDILNANTETSITTESTDTQDVIKAAIENFETARKNKEKVLTQEMGIGYMPQNRIKVDKKSITLGLSQAEVNKLKVLSTEFDIQVVGREIKSEKISLHKELTTLEINRNKVLGSNECFYGTYTAEKVDNVNFINENITNENRHGENKSGDFVEANRKFNLKKSTSLLLNLNDNLGKISKTNELDKPVPMSVDSTPVSDLPQSHSSVTTPASCMLQSIEKSSYPTTAGTHCTDEGFDFHETIDNKSYTVYTPPKSDLNTLKHTFSKRVTQEEASGLSTNCLKLLLHESVSIPVITQMKLVNNELLRYFIKDLHYLKHLSSLRDYFFLNDGEFGRNMTENLFEKLYEANVTSELINFRTLQCLVFNALDTSSKSQENYNHISFKINNMPKSFDLGDPNVLDCLSLTYQVRWPLNILLPVDTISKYDEIFKYLLKLNRMSWVLKKIVSELKILAKETGKKEIYLMTSPHYRRIHQCRHVMTHFIQTLQTYIVGEVLQSNWRIFHANLENVTNLDDLYTVHTIYIKNILFMCLLNQKTLQIRKVIHRIFVVVLKFYDYLRSRCWTCRDGAYEHPNFSKLESIFNNFEDLVLYLFKVGEKVAKSGYQPHLMRFLDMLNLNGYYSKKFV